MDPVDIVRKVYLREYRRFAQWLGTWFPADQAHRLAARAMANFWYQASSSRTTQQGPYVHLYWEAEAMVRYALLAKGEILPVSAKHTLLVPTLGELEELTRVYCTIGLACKLAALNHRDRSLIAGFIRNYDPDDEVYRSGSWSQQAENVAGFVRDRLVAALLSEVVVPERVSSAIADLYLGEVERTRRWLSNHEHRRAEQPDGDEQQDHDSDHAG